MPIQMLPPIKREQGWGEILGTGLGQGLNALMQHKVGQIQAQKKVQAWESMGLPPEQASFIVQQPESVQRDLIARLEDFGSQQSYRPYGGQQQVVPLPGEPLNRPSVTIGKSAAQKKEDVLKFKETKEFRHNIIEAKRAAKQDLQDLGRLEELSSSGKLDTPGYIEALKRVGLDIPALTNPESEEFNKIQANFLRNAKSYFGGRISNYEVEQFLKTIPSLSQSPEGRQRVIANLKKIARGADERYKAYEDVLRENRGVPPLDLEEQVERKVEKRLDRIHEQFKKDLVKPVPKGQNKFITALQAGAGSSFKPLAGAGLGAMAGSVIPGVGTLVGGLAGGAGATMANLAGLI